MIKLLKRHINRYTVGVALVYANLLFLCYHLGTRSQLVAFILAPVVLGGFWYWMHTSIQRNTVRCACGGMVTNFAGRCPCGRPVGEQPASPTLLDVEKRRTGMHN